MITWLTRRRLWIIGISLGTLGFLSCAAGAAFGAYCLWWRGIVYRNPQVVDDLPPYGEQLRAKPFNEEEPYRPGIPVYTGPGGMRRWSADLAHLAVTLDVADSFHTIAVWDRRRGTLTPVVSVQESDPGSGASHGYSWSADSQALFIYGDGSLVTREFFHGICLVYLPSRDELYRLRKCASK